MTGLYTALGVALAGLLVGCKAKPARLDYEMGERASVGNLTYTVNDTAWRGELGELFKFRSPKQRFLLVHLSVINEGREELSVPFLTIEDASGRKFEEARSGEGVSRWLGLLRDIRPGETLEGQLLFDAPLSAYKLRLSDGQTSSDLYALVNIPLRLDPEADPPGGLPGAR